MKKKDLLIAVLSGILIFSVVTFIVLQKGNDNSKVKETQVVDKLEKYGYVLKDTETDYYKDLFKDLKDLLEQDEIDDEQYARLVTQLFISDLFTISNKVSNRDIGGTQFVYSKYQSDFDKTEQSTLYSNVESNVYDERDQKLPTVSLVNIDSFEESTFNYNGTDYDGYTVGVSIDYEEDLGYPKNCTVTLIKTKANKLNKIEVAKLK